MWLNTCMNLNIYKLGHCKDLAVTEFLALTQSTDYEIHNDWLVSSHALDANKTGSIVYGGEILSGVPTHAASKERIHKLLFSIIKSYQPGFKKIGISTPLGYAGGLMELAKQAGCKKVNIIKDQLPNYGHWKQCKNWIIVTKIEDQYAVIHITSYADQEFWGNLDMNLPNNDLKRGIINLKLARSLLNLTTNTKIYDPFCGQGRIAVAGRDLKADWLLSDADPACLNECDQNLEFAAKYWYQKRAIRGEFEVKAFQHDAERLNTITQDISDFAIVTEGYLGFNPGRELTEMEIDHELNGQRVLWDGVLQAAKEQKIQEIVLCLPCYITKEAVKMPMFLKQITEKHTYTISPFNGKQGIVYRRENTKVGHFIVKLEAKSI